MFFKKDEIELLKKEAARAYRRYCDIADSRQYSCGMTLASFVTPELAREARKFNKAMRSLSMRDPKCPKYTELPEGDANQNKLKVA